MKKCSFPPWDQIPDLGLYMDQVITFIGRVYAPVYGPDVKAYLSPSMINNYVKARLIPKPQGKKYSREQLALLLMIVPLKQAATLEDIRALLAPRPDETPEAQYTAFCRRFTDDLASLDASPGHALENAIHAAAHRAACTIGLTHTP